MLPENIYNQRQDILFLDPWLFFSPDHNRKPEKKTLLGMIKYIQNLFKS